MEFADELENIFLKGMFISTDLNLTEENDYYSFLIGRHPFVVRENNVYSNVCDHRFNLIHPLGYGNQKFICGYHGKDMSHKTALNSKRFKNLLFIGQDNYLAKAIEVLTKYSVKTKKRYYSNSLEINCNWKLVVENVIESSHVPYVHNKSKDILSPFLSFVKEPLYTNLSPHSVSTVIDEAPIRLRKYIDKVCWEHIYIWPNLFVTNVSNSGTLLSYFHPTKPDHTTVHSEIYLNKSFDSRIEDVFINKSIEFLHAISEEDKVVLEQQQIGYNSMRYKEYSLDNDEPRVQWFLNNFKQ